ncbi:MAG: NAD(P)H-dependent oxidoreductase [Spirochaetia bacterium]|nr:NAD(P)H-dependent oxidoreductase [Spirochaetia bacterium]
MPLKFAVLYGSVRAERAGIGSALFFVRKLEERGHSVQFVDVKEYPLPFLDRMYKEFPAGTAPESLEKLHGILNSAEAFVVVSGEYNHSIPPALKNLLDHFQREYFFKPSGIVTYSAGQYGGARVSVHLRDVLGELGTPSISSVFNIPRVLDAFDRDGTCKDPALEKRSVRFLNELEWYADALKAKRAGGLPY